MILPLVIILIVPLILIILLIQDRKSKILLLFLGWGSIAGLLSVFWNSWIIDYLGISYQIVSIEFAPLIEEFFKALPLFILLIFHTSILKEKDTIIRAIFIGIGFSIIENYYYLINTPHLYSNLSVFFLTRSLSTTIMHGLATGFIGLVLFCIASGFFKNFKYKFIFVLMGYSFSVMFHAIFNLYVQFGLFGKVVAFSIELLLYLFAWILFGLFYKNIKLKKYKGVY